MGVCTEAVAEVLSEARSLDSNLGAFTVKQILRKLAVCLNPKPHALRPTRALRPKEMQATPRSTVTSFVKGCPWNPYIVAHIYT